MRTVRLALLAAVLLLPSVVTIVEAANFSDVSSTSLYAPAISALSDKKIIMGNPDGTFAPTRTVNRAEFLTMLYRAGGKNPMPVTSACFKDVPLDSWFGLIVCDAAANGYVGGYSDGTFKPEQPVNRVEAIKMMFTVLHLSMQSSTSGAAQASSFGDVSASAWYMQYLAAAFTLHVLPVPGADASSFGPDQPLTREEAAAYIYNAISPEPLPLDGSWPSSSSSMMSASSAMMQASSTMARSSSSSVKTAPTVTVQTKTIPFNDSGNFQLKLPQSYQFSLSQSTTVSVIATTTNDNMQGDLSCRLYKIDTTNNNFSLEYYLGYQGPDVCNMRVALAAGTYQLDVSPSIGEIPFNLAVTTTAGDNNDGFSQAKTIQMNLATTGILGSSDYGDFYSFKLAQDTQMTVNLSNADQVQCVIYPMGDVQMPSFSEPQCDQPFLFPAGTYYVGVMQKNGHWDKPSYTIQLSK